MKTFAALCLVLVPLAATAAGTDEIKITQPSTGDLVKAPTVRDPLGEACLSVKADATLDLAKTPSVTSGTRYGNRTKCPRYLVDVTPAPLDSGNHNLIVRISVEQAGAALTKRECANTKVEFYVVTRGTKDLEVGQSFAAVWRDGKCHTGMWVDFLPWDKKYRVAYSVKVGTKFRKVEVSGMQWGNPP